MEVCVWGVGGAKSMAARRSPLRSDVFLSNDGGVTGSDLAARIRRLFTPHDWWNLSLSVGANPAPPPLTSAPPFLHAVCACGHIYFPLGWSVRVATAVIYLCVCVCRM